MPIPVFGLLPCVHVGYFSLLYMCHLVHISTIRHFSGVQASPNQAYFLLSNHAVYSTSTYRFATTDFVIYIYETYCCHRESSHINLGLEFLSRAMQQHCLMVGNGVHRYFAFGNSSSP